MIWWQKSEKQFVTKSSTGKQNLGSKISRHGLTSILFDSFDCFWLFLALFDFVWLFSTVFDSFRLFFDTFWLFLSHPLLWLTLKLSGAQVATDHDADGRICELLDCHLVTSHKNGQKNAKMAKDSEVESEFFSLLFIQTLSLLQS